MRHTFCPVSSCEDQITIDQLQVNSSFGSDERVEDCYAPDDFLPLSAESSRPVLNFADAWITSSRTSLQSLHPGRVSMLVKLILG